MFTAAWARTGASTLWDRSRSQAKTPPAAVVDSIAASTASSGPVVRGQYRHPDRLGRYRRLTHHSPWWSRWWLGLGRAIIGQLGQPSDLDQLETQ